MLKDIKLWQNYADLENEYREELQSMDEKALNEAFASDLSFGTGGLREIMGVGTNRLNLYTIRKTTLGLGQYLRHAYASRPELGVAIAYDTRRNSKRFATEAARVLASLGIRAMMFDSFRPTPELSFAVRHLGCVAGIMITASHNPPKYNGYKVYDEHGCQIVPAMADVLTQYIAKIDSVFDLSLASFEDYEGHGSILRIPESFDRSYLEVVKQISCQNITPKKVRFVFSPLHGTASVFGQRVLKEAGYDVQVVPEQLVPDPDFKTVVSPNPEDHRAFTMAEALGRKLKAGILLATDPDADRMGVAVFNGQEYVYLSGNQTGALILDYLTLHKKIPAHGVVISTIVTSDLGLRIAEARGLKTRQTLTGFKFIGEQIELLKKTKQTFFFGYEESYGCLISGEVRDKDSFQALLILAEMAEFYHQQGKTLLDALDAVYQTFGYYEEQLMNIDLVGLEGKAQIDLIMDTFRKNAPSTFGPLSIDAVEDYQTMKKITHGHAEALKGFPLSNVLKFVFDGRGWIVLRPSGTEPKLKIYLSLNGASRQEVHDTMDALKRDLTGMLRSRFGINK